MTEMERIYNVFDEMDVRINDMNGVTVEFWTDTAGQDIVVEFDYDGTPEDFIREFNDKADAYDVDEEVALYINSLGKRGVPSTARELVKDCEEAKETLMEIADRLNKVYNLNRVAKVADNFISWLIYNDHFDKDYIKNDREDIINDLQNTKIVAPKLYNLIADLTDR